MVILRLLIGVAYLTPDLEKAPALLLLTGALGTAGLLLRLWLATERDKRPPAPSGGVRLLLEVTGRVGSCVLLSGVLAELSRARRTRLNVRDDILGGRDSTDDGLLLEEVYHERDNALDRDERRFDLCLGRLAIEAL